VPLPAPWVTTISMFLVVVAAFAHIASSNDAAAEKPQRNRHFIGLPLAAKTPAKQLGDVRFGN